MRILLTGAGGRIGRSIYGGVAELGHDIIVTTRSRKLANTSPNNRFLDLTERIDLSLMDGIDAVIHLAGISDRRSTVSASEFERVNCEATIELAQAANTAGVSRFIFASTLLVHGDAANEPLTSRSPVRPTDAYANSKATAERILHSRDFTRSMNIDILRIAGVRPTSDPRQPSELAQMIVDRNRLVPVSVPDNRRATASHKAVAGSIICALRRPLHSGYLISLVSDGEAGFGADIARARQQKSRFCAQVPLPRSIWRLADWTVGRMGGPSLAGVYADLRVDRASES